MSSTRWAVGSAGQATLSGASSSSGGHEGTQQSFQMWEETKECKGEGEEGRDLGLRAGKRKGKTQPQSVPGPCLLHGKQTGLLFLVNHPSELFHKLLIHLKCFLFNHRGHCQYLRFKETPALLPGKQPDYNRLENPRDTSDLLLRLKCPSWHWKEFKCCGFFLTNAIFNYTSSSILL